MKTVFYWGEKGEYGPYRMDEDGWPDAGEVMRDFRKRVKDITVKEFAVLYTHATAELNDTRGKKSRTENKTEPISEEWISNMEKHNHVPTDIKRRRIIASLLDIPPMLFGLASLEPIRFILHEEQQTITTSLTSEAIQSTGVDLSPQQKNIRLFWQLHYTDTAQDHLGDLQADIQVLEAYEQYTQGTLLKQVQGELFGQYLLSSAITRDQRKFQTSYMYANQAVKIAKKLEVLPLLGSALYERGYTRMTWGLFGEIDEVGIFKRDPRKIADAIADFELALQHAHPQLKGNISLELARAKGTLTQTGTDITIALTLADQAEKWIGIGQTDDFLTRVLLTRTGLSQGRVCLGRANTYNAVGRPGKAIDVLESLRELKSGKSIPKNYTRYLAVIDIVQANAYMELKEFENAAFYAKTALTMCQDIKSTSNITIITEIYSRLRNGPCRNHPEIVNLGNVLRDWYTTQN